MTDLRFVKLNLKKTVPLKVGSSQKEKKKILLKGRRWLICMFELVLLKYVIKASFMKRLSTSIHPNDQLQLE